MSKPNQDAVFAALYAEAVAAGTQAAQAMTPRPMIVGEAKSLMSNEIDYSKPIEYVADGVCGFAWVNVKPGTSAFAKWLVKNGHARRDDYYGGVTIWIREYNQSMQRKEAHAQAMAEVLRKGGIERAYAHSRMD